MNDSPLDPDAYRTLYKQYAIVRPDLARKMPHPDDFERDYNARNSKKVPNNVPEPPAIKDPDKDLMRQRALSCFKRLVSLRPGYKQYDRRENIFGTESKRKQAVIEARLLDHAQLLFYKDLVSLGAEEEAKRILEESHV